MNEHSPTPWHINHVLDAFVPVMMDKLGYSEETAEANAEFICLAVNNHDSLLEACKAAYKEVKTGEALQKLTDAISKAEGRT